jgi:hypothetical protein
MITYAFECYLVPDYLRATNVAVSIPDGVTVTLHGKFFPTGEREHNFAA